MCTDASICTTANRPYASDHWLIHRLWNAFTYPEHFQALLAEPDTLRAIMNTIEVRSWLFEQLKGRSERRNTFCPQACQHLIRMMEASTMMRGRGHISEEIYEEAYARTWEWFLKKLPTYDPEKASFVHWFNQKLRFVIHDVIREWASDQARKKRMEEAGTLIKPARQGDRPWQETVQEWIGTVERNAPDFCRCRMQDPHAHINCHDLLLNILRSMLTEPFFIDAVDWAHLAQSQDISPASLKRFCQGRCFQTFKKLTESL